MRSRVRRRACVALLVRSKTPRARRRVSSAPQATIVTWVQRRRCPVRWALTPTRPVCRPRANVRRAQQARRAPLARSRTRHAHLARSRRAPARLHAPTVQLESSNAHLARQPALSVPLATFAGRAQLSQCHVQQVTLATRRDCPVRVSAHPCPLGSGRPWAAVLQNHAPRPVSTAQAPCGTQSTVVRNPS